MQLVTWEKEESVTFWTFSYLTLKLSLVWTFPLALVSGLWSVSGCFCNSSAQSVLVFVWSLSFAHVTVWCVCWYVRNREANEIIHLLAVQDFCKHSLHGYYDHGDRLPSRNDPRLNIVLNSGGNVLENIIVQHYVRCNVISQCSLAYVQKALGKIFNKSRSMRYYLCVDIFSKMHCAILLWQSIELQGRHLLYFLPHKKNERSETHHRKA